MVRHQKDPSYYRRAHPLSRQSVRGQPIVEEQLIRGAADLEPGISHRAFGPPQ